MVRQLTIAAVVVGALVGSDAWAQRAGGRGGGAPRGGGSQGGAPPSADEKSRAENAQQWAADIEKVRAQSPPPPLPQIRFPSQNEKLLSQLRWAENPKRDLTQYLDKLWKDGKDATARRLAFEQLWRDAEKPKWARAATEDYFQKHANAALKSPPAPASLDKPPAPASLDKPAAPASLDKPPAPASLDKPPAPASLDKPPAPASLDKPVAPAPVGPAPEPATLPPASSHHSQ